MTLRIAIVGCGAVAEQAHLPTIAGAADTRITLLVDRNRARTAALARAFQVPHTAEDYAAVFEHADAAIVALPHYLHAPVCVDLLGRGVHVLVEKPMALTAQECDLMLAAAERGQAVLAVGLMRHFLRSTRFVKEAIDAGTLGAIRSFDVREGYVYNWPVASDFFFRKEAAGGGVLIDTGAHTLDSLLWWLGDVRSFDYQDDSHGGVEADCVIDLTLESGATGTVELSRTRNLRNTAVIRGDRATLEVGWSQVTLSPAGSDLRLGGLVKPSRSPGVPDQEYLDAMSASLTDWLEAIRTGRPPTVLGVEARRSVALMEDCYRHRSPLELSWSSPWCESTLASRGV